MCNWAYAQTPRKWGFERTLNEIIERTLNIHFLGSLSVRSMSIFGEVEHTLNELIERTLKPLEKLTLSVRSNQPKSGHWAYAQTTQKVDIERTLKPLKS